jgi:nucleoid-associated protein YgaU
MNATPQALLQFAGVKPSLFAANSRYRATETAIYVAPDGRSIRYLRRRFVPQPTDLVQVGQYTVTQGDRSDIIAARYLGDPTLFWRLCDANRSLRPEDLAAIVGATLRICLPEGLQGGQNAP